jgi:DNA-binding transcriptional MerR regulator
MSEIRISFNNGKIAFLKGNRDINTNKCLEKSIKEIGVMTPIQVVTYGVIKNWEVTLIDPSSKKEIDTPTDDTYVIIDGQHRYFYALKAYQEAMKSEEVGEECNLLIDYIPAVTMDKDCFNNRHPLTLIPELNSTLKSWTPANYIESAHLRNNEDELLSIIKFFKDLGFSISVISLFLFFSRNILTPSSLIGYVEGKVSFEDANPQRALELYRLLRKVGFSIKFIKKRYLIELLVKKHNASIIKFNMLIDEISKLDENTIRQIEAMNPLDLSNGKHEITIKNYAKNCNCAEKYSIDESEEIYKENMFLIQDEVNEFRISQEDRKCRKKKFPDKRKRNTGDDVNITKTVSIDDVK